MRIIKLASEISTVGELKAFLARIPDDTRLGGYPANGLDYNSMSFYIADRSKDIEWETQKEDPKLKEWWMGEVPAVVLVCSVD